MQCGGSVNCPTELQNTSLCGDRKVPRVSSYWSISMVCLGMPGCSELVSSGLADLQLQCHVKRVPRYACHSFKSRTAAQANMPESSNFSIYTTICIPQAAYTAPKCDIAPVMCSTGHASTQHLAASATTPTTGSASPPLRRGMCPCHSPPWLPRCPLQHQQASSLNKASNQSVMMKFTWTRADVHMVLRQRLAWISRLSASACVCLLWVIVSVTATIFHVASCCTKGIAGKRGQGMFACGGSHVERPVNASTACRWCPAAVKPCTAQYYQAGNRGVVMPAGAVVVHAGSSAPGLAAPRPSMQTVTEDNPPMQVDTLYIYQTRDCRQADECPGPAAFWVDSTSTNWQG